MFVTIRYKLSVAGRKADILAGGDGAEVKERRLSKDDACFAEAVMLGDLVGGRVLIRADEGRSEMMGEGRTSMRSWVETRLWDAEPTTDELLAAERERIDQHEANYRAHLAKVREETLAVLRERRTHTESTLEETEYEGARGTARAVCQVPAWPYVADQEVMGSPEAVAWTNELALAREAEIAQAKAAAAASARAARQSHLEEQQRRAEAAAAEEARRAALNLGEDDLDLKIENGALTEIPEGCWEPHSRGKNWMAVIQIDPSKPGGLDRAFAAKARGDGYYLLPSLSPGDALEFGADYYSGRGRKNPTRWYGYVLRVEDDALIVHRCASGKTAVKEGAAYARRQGPAAASPVDAAIVWVNGEGVIEA